MLLDSLGSLTGEKFAHFAEPHRHGELGGIKRTGSLLAIEPVPSADPACLVFSAVKEVERALHAHRRSSQVLLDLLLCVAAEDETPADQRLLARFTHA